MKHPPHGFNVTVDYLGRSGIKHRLVPGWFRTGRLTGSFVVCVAFWLWLFSVSYMRSDCPTCKTMEAGNGIL